MYKIITLSLFLIGTQLNAQEHNPAVQSVDGIVAEVLNILSGEKGKVRDWEKYRNLFLPSARFTILNHPSDSMSMPYEMVNLDDFIELMQDQYYEEGFLEVGTGNVINEYNGIANVFQSFYAKDSEGSEGRGLTSYQLVYYNERWWIADILWTTDSNGVPIPSKYLKE